MAHDCLDCGQMCYCDMEDTFLESLSHDCIKDDCDWHPDNDYDADDDFIEQELDRSQDIYVAPWPVSRIRAYREE